MDNYYQEGIAKQGAMTLTKLSVMEALDLRLNDAAQEVKRLTEIKELLLRNPDIERIFELSGWRP